MRTRLAPTPSGYLHVGNLVNFALTAHWAREFSAEIALRIDDIDAPRTRREYIDDIFRVIDWLGIKHQVGPATADDLSSWSQNTRLEHYRSALETIQAHPGLSYACVCTRASLVSSPCRCATRDREFTVGRTALRMRTDDGADPILWRRDGLPAYHLTSVVDDDLLGITLVVRGEDLRPSTAIQRDVAALLPGNTFGRARVIHHPLIEDVRGVKMSKSAGAGAQPLSLTDQLREDIAIHVSRYSAEITP